MRSIGYFPYNRPADLTRFYDGSVWLAEAGIDFECETDSFIRAVLHDAHARKIRVHVKRINDDVAIQVVL